MLGTSFSRERRKSKSSEGKMNQSNSKISSISSLSPILDDSGVEMEQSVPAADTFPEEPEPEVEIASDAPAAPSPPSEERMAELMAAREAALNLPMAKHSKQLEFHYWFPDLPKDETLIDDFHAASRESIIIQGRLYISYNFICFRSTVLPHVPHIIPITNIIAIEPKTHLKLPNSIFIELDDCYYFFTHLLNRQDALDLILRVYNLQVEPQSKLRRENKCIKIHDSDDDECSDCINGVEGIKPNYTGRGPVIDEYRKRNAQGYYVGTSSSRNSRSNSLRPSFNNNEETRVRSASHNDVKSSSFTGRSLTFPRAVPVAQPKTQNIQECSCDLSGYTKILDRTFNASLETVFDYIIAQRYDNFRDLSWFRNRKLENVKLSNWDSSNTFEAMERNLVPLKEGEKMPFVSELSSIEAGNGRNMTFVMPLDTPIVKSTRCLFYERVLCKAPTKVCVESLARTPDVPFSETFSSKTRVRLQEVEPNVTRVEVLFGVEWIKSIWMIKNQIEISSRNGIQDAYESLFNLLEEQLASNNQIQPLSQELNDRISEKISLIEKIDSPRVFEVGNQETGTVSLPVRRSTRVTRIPKQILSFKFEIPQSVASILTILIIILTVTNSVMTWILLNKVKAIDTGMAK